MKFSPYLIAVILAAASALPASGETQPTPPAKPVQSPQRSDTIAGAVGLNELKIEMAESRLKLAPNPKIYSDLVVALEDYLNSTCMAKLPQTLTYAGNPSDPTCIARMQRLLEINSGNPVATCVRDGIAAKTCIDAYQDQKIWIVYPASKDDVDPALKVGLSAMTLERIAKVEGSLQEVNKKYQETLTHEEKRALLNDAANLYDQILNMACKVSAVGLAPDDGGSPLTDSSEVTQARDRLLQIPSGIRGDYQREMAAKAQKELDDPNTTSERATELKELIAVIQNPNGLSPRQTNNLQRTRYILSKCAEVIDVAAKIVPDLPSVTCFREGWYTPKCIYALKKWRMQKQQEANAVTGTPGPAPTKSSMITRF